MFDMTTLDILKPSEEGKWFYPVHPSTGKRLIGPEKDGQAMGFLMYGRHSVVVRDALRRLNDALQAERDAGREPSDATSERLQGEYLAACTKTWTPFKLDGAEMPFTTENAIRFWCDGRFRWMHAAAREHIFSDGVFLAG